ncbi:ribonucleoside-diphosphate reductase, adenosylcobalamin-dependent [Aciduliprofundum boonei T469]|uniref:Vitamin B12-dependent ribonucleotide reductase n=2 Tax=Candidatus Aciduliprofundum boonei TaxID=379547 RepID=D3TA40_ACIB4|nr:ribonucleoside-diphosphate reductase, adenosylcobalamin-dependent [Aciduliprofundum boonei T469]
MSEEGEVMKVIKRDGRIVDFSEDKIFQAIMKAMNSIGGYGEEDAQRVTRKVVEKIKESRVERITVEKIQDIVEETLMLEGYINVAKSYILYREERRKIRQAKKVIGVQDDLKLTVNAIKVLEARYLLKDENGNVIETPRQMFERTARYLALVDIFYEDDIYDKEGKQKERKIDVEEKPEFLSIWEFNMLKRAFTYFSKEGYMKVDFSYVLDSLKSKWDKIERVKNKFAEVMLHRKYVPNSPTLMNANTKLGQLSACFVLPVPDSIEGIFNAVKYAAMIHKSGGGTGFSFSRLRPKGDIVASTMGVASGPLSFMRVFDVATDVIKQGGKRRGANMGVLSVHHPDILEFITSKDSENKVLSNFNISVAVTDEFMDALLRDDYYPLRNPRNGEEVKRIKARQVWDLIITQAWKTGDPGVIFIDEVNRKHPVKHLGEIESTNPCGEQPLLPYESCNLGSINLSLFVENGKIKWDDLRDTVHTAVHFMDNVIDANNYPLPQVAEMTRRSRKIGLGVMGWAEMLIKLGIPYDSEEAVELAEKVMKFINEESHRASMKLAEKRGVFPAWEGSEWWKKGMKIRNATTTTIAPTGTISIIAGTSSSIEPLFAIAFIRRVLDGQELLEVNPLFEEIMKREGLYSEELMHKVAETGSVQHIDDVPENIKRLFRTAHDIDPVWHVRMQAAFQKYVDNAVSKTVNLRHDASISDVEDTYILAWKLKCKGITIYRDGSKNVQVIYKGTKTTKQEIKEEKKKESSANALIDLTFNVKVEEKYLKVDSTFDPACPTGKCDQ